MSFGRFIGWIMLLGGLGLAARWYILSDGSLSWSPFNGRYAWSLGEPMGDYMSRSLAEQFSAALASPWMAALLILFGALALLVSRGGSAR